MFTLLKKLFTVMGATAGLSSIVMLPALVKKVTSGCGTLSVLVCITLPSADFKTKGQSPTWATLQFNTKVSVLLLVAKLESVQAPLVSTVTEVRKSLPPMKMVAVRPYCRDCTLTPVTTGGKPVLPPQALIKAISVNDAKNFNKNTRNQTKDKAFNYGN